MTNVVKIAMKAGNSIEEITEAGLEVDYTRQGIYSAIRSAGFRTRSERSDKGQTLKVKIGKLIEEARALEARLTQQSSGSSTGNQ
ncbi:hypothetical protein EBX31_02925 [bacterium]|nr:hypothetical protein [bacterium]